MPLVTLESSWSTPADLAGPTGFVTVSGSLAPARVCENKFVELEGRQIVGICLLG